MSTKYPLSGEMPHPPPRAPNPPRPPPPCGSHASCDGVVEGGVGQPHVLRAVQTDAVQLHLHVVVAVASGVEDDACGFVDLQERSDLEAGVRGQRRDQLAAQIVKIEVAPAVPLRFPDEATAVFEKRHRRAVLDPSRRPFLADDRAGPPGLGIRRREFEDVLLSIGPVEEQLRPVRRPRDAIDVVADDVVVEGPAVSNVHFCAFLRRDVVHEQVDDGIRRARLRIRLDVVLALNLRLIDLEVVVGYLLFVEPVVGDPAAVGGPPHGRPLTELFTVDPARRPYLIRSLSLPSVVTATSLPPLASLTHRFRSR